MVWVYTECMQNPISLCVKYNDVPILVLPLWKEHLYETLLENI